MFGRSQMFLSVWEHGLLSSTCMTDLHAHSLWLTPGCVSLRAGAGLAGLASQDEVWVHAVFPELWYTSWRTAAWRHAEKFSSPAQSWLLFRIDLQVRVCSSLPTEGMMLSFASSPLLSALPKLTPGMFSCWQAGSIIKMCKMLLA